MGTAASGETGVSSILESLESLSQTHGASALAAAFRSLQRQVRVQRRKDGKQFGPLARTIQAAIRIWDGQKADGIAEPERVAGLEKTLRAAWPQVREWKYLCSNCADYGLVMAVCGGDRFCGRDHEHLAHEFGRPCWCSAGQKFKPKPVNAEDFTQAAKTKPTRIGR
jgi:hypothetical protein